MELVSFTRIRYLLNRLPAGRGDFENDWMLWRDRGEPITFNYVFFVFLRRSIIRCHHVQLYSTQRIRQDVVFSPTGIIILYLTLLKVAGQFGPICRNNSFSKEAMKWLMVCLSPEYRPNKK